MSTPPPPPPGSPEYLPQMTPYGVQRSGKATASLVLGIIGLFICPLICSILAIVFGVQSRNEIDRSMGRIEGRSLAVAGMVLGIIGLVLTPLWIFVASR